MICSLYFFDQLSKSKQITSTEKLFATAKSISFTNLGLDARLRVVMNKIDLMIINLSSLNLYIKLCVH